MNQELRFILAIALMIGVLVGTNILFPPVPPPDVPEGLFLDSLGVATQTDSTTPTRVGGEAPVVSAPAVSAPAIPTQGGAAAELITSGDAAPAEEVVVETPLFRLRFSSLGARLTSVELLEFENFAGEGLVELLSAPAGVLGAKIQVSNGDVDLSGQPFEISSSGFTMADGAAPRELVFSYQHPDQAFGYSVSYTFHADRYLVDVQASVSGVDRPLLLADLGSGIAYNESKPSEEARSMGYAINHVQDGIRAVLHRKVDQAAVEGGPFIWTAHKSKYFVFGLLAGAQSGTDTYVGEVRVSPSAGDDFAQLEATIPFAVDGTVAYRVYLGPQEFDRLTAVGDDFENVNPYGWRFMRGLIRPLVGLVLFVLTGLHTGLSLGYGWVLIIFGVAMRIVLFPLNHKAMKAQMRNMAVQPLMQDIQKRYKDKPERLQKEMMKLYKDHGFNPLAGCLPMLIPWPVLITLFFVFQNTIELRGVPFLWLPSLSGPDPLFILPLLLGVSMFLMQWISLRVTPNPNPQMKMMMWIMPVMMTFIFLNFASGLNLYYATANIATLPQQIWIAKERAKVKPIPIPSD